MANNSEYRNKWIAEKLDRVNLTMPKGKKEKVHDYAAAVGMSVNAYINEAIDEKMERDSAFTETMERDNAATEEA